MKRNFFLSAFASVLVLGLLNTSCSKERTEDDAPPSLNEYANTNSYLNDKEQEEQTYTVDSLGTGPIVGQQGTQMWPHKEIFMYPNGDSVHYPFQIGIIEIYKPIDMAYSQMPTVSDNNLLTTGGEVRVKVYKDGTELVLRPNKFLVLDFPTATHDNNMRVYYGQENGSFVNWTNPNDSLQNIDTASAHFYRVFTHRMNWINCDYFSSYTGSMSSFNFTSATENINGLAKFIYFDNRKSMMQVYSPTSADVPVGEDVKIILFGKNASNQLFYYYNDTIVNSANNYDITLTQTTETQLDSLLNTF